MPDPSVTPDSTNRRLQDWEDGYAPQSAPSHALWLETLGIPVAAIGLAWWWRTDDPTLAAATFPWLWFAPVLVALRYGVLPGLLAIAPLLANWFLAARLLGDASAFPQGHFFGGILLTLLCGEFADAWRERNARIEEASLYLAERVSRLTRRHLLLNLSHDRLEQEMLTRPGSLRDALTGLRDEIFVRKDGEALPASRRLLDLAASHANLLAATLYPVEAADVVRLGPPLHAIGKPAPLAADDELLKLALERRDLAHVADASAVYRRSTNQLVVAPVVASDQQVLAVLAVSEMPFLSLNDENLLTLSAILGYYADCVRGAPRVAELRSLMPAMPPLYAEELGRMLAIGQRLGLDSHILVMGFGGARGGQIADRFPEIKRGLDLHWRADVAGTPTIALLMPLASRASVDGFLRRFDDWLRTRFGGNAADMNISWSVIDFATHDPVAELQRRMGRG